MGLQSSQALCTLLEVCTGDSYAHDIGLFGEPTGSGTGQWKAVVKDVFDSEKESMSKRAMSRAGYPFVEGMRVKRMRLGPTAVSRRVTETARTTFGHQPRKQAYGKRRWRTDTGALIAAERASLQEVV